jgi:hypothetical protein
LSTIRPPGTLRSMVTDAGSQRSQTGFARLSGRTSVLLEAAQAGATEILEGFRRSDRFFKMRLGIVAVWALLSAATLWGTCGSLGIGSSFGADVQVNRDSIMGVQLLVRNASNDIWEDVTLTLDDGWKYSQRTMRPQDLVVIPMSHFKKAGEAPPPGHEPRSLTIECGRGKSRFVLR